MNAKLLSEYTVADVAAALRIDDNPLPQETADALTRAMAMATAYIEGITSIPAASEDPEAETLDQHPDIVHAFLVLCQDAYDNRAYVQDGTTGVNQVVDSILGMHRRCLVA